MQRATTMLGAFLVLVTLCGLAPASAHTTSGAGPCITCVQCLPTDSFCLSQCKTSCPTPVPQPAVTVDVRICSTYGADQGRTAAQQACQAALQYCTGSPAGGLIVGSGAPQVSLTQCGEFCECLCGGI